MDISLLIAFALVLAVLVLCVGFLLKPKPSKPAVEVPQRAAPNRAQNAVPRRAQIARNQRARFRANAVQDQDSEDDEREDVEETKTVFDEKIGAKKRAKLEAKAEKKVQREAEEKQRQEKKVRDQQLDEERKREEEKQQAEEKRLEEEEKKVREEKAKQEYEEYLKMKQAFSVEEEGYEEGETDEQNLLQEFVGFIKKNKVVVVEDLAAQFKLKTQAAIDRIQDLQKDEILSGVLDDRGKFIYISQQELESVAKFIRQRGRVSITELAENSNSLINLAPVA